MEIEPTVKFPAPVLVPRVTSEFTAVAFVLNVSAPVDVSVVPSLIISAFATVGVPIVIAETVALPVIVRVTPLGTVKLSVVDGVKPVPAVHPLHVAVP
jgi:hypothetical protein